MEELNNGSNKEMAFLGDRYLDANRESIQAIRNISFRPIPGLWGSKPWAQARMRNMGAYHVSHGLQEQWTRVVVSDSTRSEP